MNRPAVGVSICVPVYFAERTIVALTQAIIRQLEGESFEIILVDDGSKDASPALCERLAREDPRIRFVGLRKNAGEHNAVMCALNHASGEVAITMDCDFQHPPEVLPLLLARIREGYDLVYTRPSTLPQNWFRVLGSRFANRVATFLLDKPRDLYLSSFRAMHGEVVREIIRYRGPFPYVDGLLLRVTDSIGVVDVAFQQREVGRSNYTLRKLTSLWLNMFLNFSIKPLRLFTSLGIGMALLGFVGAMAAMGEKILFPGTPMGWASVYVALLLFSGVQLIFIGLLGEYLGKMYLDHSGKPQWVIRRKYPE